MLNDSVRSKIRGSGYFILNLLRICNIISLLAVSAAAWAMIVLSGLTNQFWFFDTASHFFTFFICMFLVVSEVGVPKKYFRNTWPVLSEEHSLAWFGLALIMIGCNLLGDLNKPVYSDKNLGLPVWRLIMASGILIMIFGIFNILASIIFRDGQNNVTARGIRADGNLARDPGNNKSLYDDYSQRSVREEQDQPSRFKRMTQRFDPKRMTQRLDPKSWRKSRMEISKPISHPHLEERSVEPTAAVEDDGFKVDRSSPIAPTYQRPPTRLHPAMTGNSHYSEAYMSRYGDDSNVV